MEALEKIVPVVLGLSVISACAVMVRKLFGDKQTKKNTKTLLLDPSVKYRVRLCFKKDLSHDTRLFRFELPSKKHVLGLPVGQHIYLSVRLKDSDRLITRPYTPTSSDKENGYFELVVKVYFSNVHPNYPKGGKMSQYLDQMFIGDEIDIRGPKGNLIYNGVGCFSIKQKVNDEITKSFTFHTVSMIAGGTGITPMLQLLKSALDDPADRTRFSLIFANQSEDDILLRDELEMLQAEHSTERFKIWFTVDKSTPEWAYDVGYVTSKMISDHLFAPAVDSLVVLCGPQPMIQFACLPNLETLGYSSDRIFVF